jgi:23S rRNA pseudouridine1911/1915/1917 synthase
VTDDQDIELKLGRIPQGLAGQRLDQALAAIFPEHSRSQLQQWIREGLVRVDGREPRARDKVHGDERVELRVPASRAVEWSAQPLPLALVYEDDTLVVVNKPAGMVVHPGAGNVDGTLLNALLHHDPGLAAIPRAGIVHRLDKDTSGLLVIARTDTARRHLTEQLKARTVKRVYTAIVRGVMVAGGTVEAPVGRHARDRTRMAVTARGRPAVSHYRIVARYRAHTRVQVHLETGRTHQIRVHLAHVGHPIVGDPVYGGRQYIPADAGPRLQAVLRGFRRQALHAGSLGLIHPASGEQRHWDCPLPEDMRELIDALEEDARDHGLDVAVS